MGEFFGFILFWLLIMALIGVALKVVAIWGQKKASEKAECGVVPRSQHYAGASRRRVAIRPLQHCRYGRTMPYGTCHR